MIWSLAWKLSSGLEKHIIFGCCLSLLADDTLADEAVLWLTEVAELAKEVKFEKKDTFSHLNSISRNFFTVILPSGP